MEPAALPALHGWLWVMHGFALFRAYAALWLLLLFLYWVALLLSGLIPLVGPLAALCLIPGIGAGLMVACQAAQQRQAPTLRHVIEPLRRNRKGQLQLGLVYLAGTLVALAASSVADGGLFLRASLFGVERAVVMQAAPAFTLAFFVFMVVLAPVMVGFWFAPALVHWQGMPPAKALFFSFFACLRNWRPFLVYALGWLFFLGTVPILIVFVLGLVLPADLRSATLASFIVMPYMLVVLGAMVCSFYSTYVAIFSDRQAPA